MTTAVMFVMYVGYLLVRSLSTDFGRRATRAAILGVVLVIDVPIVHLSVLWANSLHQLPTVLRAGGAPSLDSAMLLTLMVSVGAFTLVYLYLMTVRVSLEAARRARLGLPAWSSSSPRTRSSGRARHLPSRRVLPTAGTCCRW